MQDNLISVYEEESASSKLLLRYKFHECRMNPNESVIQHVATIQNFASQSANIGETISEIDNMAKILDTESIKIQCSRYSMG